MYLAIASWLSVLLHIFTHAHQQLKVDLYFLQGVWLFNIPNADGNRTSSASVSGLPATVAWVYLMLGVVFSYFELQFQQQYLVMLEGVIILMLEGVIILYRFIRMS